MRANDPTSRLFNLRCLATAALLGAAIFVSPSHGQGTPPPPPGGGDMGGPKVPPGAKDGEGDFGGEGRRPGRPPMGNARGQMQSARAWMETWKEFKGTLAADVQAKADTIQKEFEAKVQAWQKENGEKMRELAEQARGGAEGGGKPDKAAMDQLKQLNESRPKIEEAHKQMFALLSPEQQEAFKKKLAETEKRMKEQMGKREGRGGENEGKGGPGARGKGKGGKKPGDDAPPPAGPDGNPPPPPMDTP